MALLEHMRERFSDRPAWTDTRERVAATIRGERRITVYRMDGTTRPHGVQHEDDAMTVTLSVNGKTHRVEADPETPLLYVLRDDLQLNGAKYGCGIGQCGSCTVMVDGEAVLSCVTPLLLLEGRKVTTVEGLGTLENPGPMQRAFIEEQAAQCGYCIPGMMMRWRCWRTPPARRRRSRAARTNLCRCAHIAGGDARRRADAAELPGGRSHLMTGHDEEPDPPRHSGRRRLPGGELLRCCREPIPRRARCSRPRLPRSRRRSARKPLGDPFLDAWIRIDAKGEVTVFTGKAELGQGVKTALIQIAAEELELDPTAIHLVADTTWTPDEATPREASRSRTAAPPSGMRPRRCVRS